MENQKEVFGNPRIFTRGVYVENVRVSIDISGEAILMLQRAMSLCNIDYDGSDEDQKEAVDFFTKEFFPYVNQLAQQLEQESGT